MITLLVGHRGVGKTSLLGRLKKYFPQAACFCLDEEIEKRFGKIDEIFSKQGEARFRELEKNVLNEILVLCAKQPQSFVALGAGFEGPLPSVGQVVWVQRVLDLSQFVFLNRPDLNPQSGTSLISPEVFKARTLRYREWATAEYLMPEGEYDELPEEEQFFKNKFKSLRGVITVLPQHAALSQFASWLTERCAWGVDFIELRDDLLSVDQINVALSHIPLAQRLFSFRQPERIQASLSAASLCAQVDWPLEFGAVPESIKDRVLISHHGDSVHFESDLQKLEKLEVAVKWSPLIETLQQLEKAHRWRKNGSQRSLLPRSLNGRWAWYRLWQKDKQPLSFFREGEGSAADQPSLVQWAGRDSLHVKGAAVLGSPVEHSWTPVFHRAYFKKKKMDVVAIEVSEAELNSGGLEFLHELGFCAFAVTSPLKNWAGQASGLNEPLNTLAWSEVDGRWHGRSTDKQGFLALVQTAEILFTRGRDTVIWGGGGTLPLLKEVLPQAQLYSAQTGRPRPENSAVAQPKTVVWAAGDGVFKISSSHPEWKPEKVVDLNYRGDSAGIAYAKKTGARYFSGRDMFVAQGEAQQKFWSDYEF